MKKGWLVLGLVAGLVGCATSDLINRQIRAGAFTFSEVKAENYDYQVNIERLFDIDFDTSKPEDRMTVIRQLLGPLCPNPTVVDETYIDRGKAPLGGVRLGTYVVKVSCKP